MISAATLVEEGHPLDTLERRISTPPLGSNARQSAVVDRRTFPLGVSTVCDSSCLARGEELPRFGGYLCGDGDTLKYGESCRLCYTDLEEAQIAEEELRESRTRDAAEKMEEDCVEGRHVIMCDTLAPPPARGCHSDCTTESEAVCDMRCKDEHSESMNCNWR
ncbi:unnamed protein product, partial [Choristocarpus tenellus]